MANMFFAPSKCHKVESDVCYYKRTLNLSHSWNNPLLYYDMFLHYWKRGDNTGSYRENVGCIGVVSSVLLSVKFN